MPSEGQHTVSTVCVCPRGMRSIFRASFLSSGFPKSIPSSEDNRICRKYRQIGVVRAGTASALASASLSTQSTSSSQDSYAALDDSACRLHHTRGRTSKGKPVIANTCLVVAAIDLPYQLHDLILPPIFNLIGYRYLKPGFRTWVLLHSEQSVNSW